MSAIRADAGLYAQTLESMLFSPPSEQTDKKKFNDADLLKKKKSVSKLVEKFESCNLDETIEEAFGKMAMEPSEMAPTPKPRTVFKTSESSPEDINIFFQGIRKTSSPIPTTPEDPVTPEAVFHDLKETPILVKKSGPKTLDFAILDSTKVQKIRHRDSILIRKSQMSETRQSRTKTGSTCSSEASTSSSTGSATPSGASAASTPSGLSSSNGSQDLDIYLKIARADIHRIFPKYYRWDLETLRKISEQVSSIRLHALQGAPRDAMTNTMMTIYQKCINGEVTKEMDALAASIFDLMDKNVHEKQLSTYEEYLVIKYSKKLFS
uniref:TBC1 domain family member 9 n=1 Tax=Caenorhabditis tropicalis TaxID=1561998 RepID=A0A1I7TPM5_9PELO